MRPIRRHLTYANVISTLCLFLLLGGGTAVALNGSNTVFSDDIVNGQVGTNDLAISAGKTYSNRITVPTGTSGLQTVLTVPGYGKLRVDECTSGSANSRWVNSTSGAEDVARSNTLGGFDRKIVEPGKGLQTQAIDTIWQIARGTGTNTQIATIIEFGIHANFTDGTRCVFEAQATVQAP